MSQNIFSVEGLISWLELQPGETEYNYGSNTDCLLCRYLKARGVPVASMGPNKWYDEDWGGHALPGASEGGNENPLNGIANGPGRFTYAAALSRARAMVAS